MDGENYRELLKLGSVGVPWWLSWLNIWFLISTQVMISCFIGLKPTLGSELMVQSLLRILSPFLSLRPFPSLHSLSLFLCLCLSLSLSLCLSKIKK